MRFHLTTVYRVRFNRSLAHGSVSSPLRCAVASLFRITRQSRNSHQQLLKKIYYLPVFSGGVSVVELLAGGLALVLLFEKNIYIYM